MDPRARARGVLAEAGPLLEHLLTTVGMGVVVTDVQTDGAPIVYVNPAFEEMTGYGAPEAIGRNCRFLQGEGTDPRAVRAMADAVRAGEEHTVTVLNYRRDGAPFWNQLRLAPIPDEDDEPRYYLGLLTDVTEQRLAESALAEADALRSAVFSLLAEGILVLDESGHVVEANPSALRLLDVAREQLERPDWWSRLDVRRRDGSSVAVPTSAGSSAYREQRPVLGVRLRVRRGDGAERLMSVNYEPMRPGALGGSDGLVISFRDVTDRTRVEEELQLFASLVSIANDFVAIAALDQTVLYVNEAGRRLVGLGSLAEAQTKRISDFLTDAGRRDSAEVEQPAVIADGQWSGEGTLRHFVTGATIPVRISSYLVRHPETGEPWALATVQRDITEEKRFTAELVSSRERYEAQFRSLPLPTYVWRRAQEDFVLVEWNSAAEEITHGGLAEQIGARASEFYADDPRVTRAFERAWRTRSHVTVEMPYRLRSTGDTRHLIVTYAFVPPDLVLVHTLDITRRVESEQELIRMTERDDLTGLYNRRYFEHRLDEALGVMDVAVLIVDVDHFKFVNDSLGHGPGDELLREVASAMRSRLRDTDVLARFGGDEFAVLLLDADESHARAAANHTLAAIRTRVTGVSVTASAGAAVFSRQAQIGTSDAIVAADIALYAAKQGGRDRCEFYAGQAGQSLTWLQQIRSAIDSDRLLFHGQPVIGLQREIDVPMYELLVRMHDEHGGIIPPGSFLPTAEQFGLIRDIDRWMVQRGIELAARGRRVSINLSARSLADPSLPGQIGELLRRTGAPPSYVTFEFTETAAVSNLEDARTFTVALSELGCNAALDDFGTGFGTFLLLKHLPVSALKIDREFVLHLSRSEADQEIVRNIVHIAQGAGMYTVAEGVEDAGALALLREYGVDFAQGFHIARPAPLD